MVQPPADFPDRRGGRVYLMPEKLELAVGVGLATGRPLLLRGEPGAGKSSLAAYVARERGWRYFEHVVTSQTQARDLLWTFDGVRRLADAQAGGNLPRTDTYIQPGVLWGRPAPGGPGPWRSRRACHSATSTPTARPITRSSSSTRSTKRTPISRTACSFPSRPGRSR